MQWACGDEPSWTQRNDVLVRLDSIDERLLEYLD